MYKYYLPKYQQIMNYVMNFLHIKYAYENRIKDL